jgi:hypothetical protein
MERIAGPTPRILVRNGEDHRAYSKDTGEDWKESLGLLHGILVNNGEDHVAILHLTIN